MSILGTDNGPNPYVVDIEAATLQNNAFRDTLWTGEHLQLTVMSIPAGGEIGAEVHDTHDQFLRIEGGAGRMMIGTDEDNLDVDQIVEHDDAVFIPAGKWHNLVNEGQEPVKLYSIYAPAEHPHGTYHETKEDADNSPHHH